MKKPLSSLPLFGLAAGLALAACDSAPVDPETSSVAAPSRDEPFRRPSAYETEILSLKARVADPAKRETAIRAAMIRHGFRPAGPRPDASPASPPVGGSPAAKSAGPSKVIRAKEFEFDFAWVITRRIAVGSNLTLDAYTTRTASAQNVDPRIVAFYADGPDESRTTTRIVGLNDDYSGLDSRIHWKNTTGSTRIVTVHVFAYSPSSTGVATLTYTLTNPQGQSLGKVSRTGAAFATAVSANLPPGPGYPCEQDPADSVIDLDVLYGGHYKGGLVAVNASLMRGAYVSEGVPSFAMGFVIPPNGGNFLLGIFEGDGDGFYEPTRYRAEQDDFYPFCL